MTIQFYVDLETVCKERNHTLTSVFEVHHLR